jgi:hypothetical protein
MPPRRVPIVGCLFACLAAIVLGGAGCNSNSSSEPWPETEGKVIRIGYMIVESVPPGATVWVNEEERGSTPLHLRVGLGLAGELVSDMEFKFEWADGKSDVTYRLARGTQPPSALKINSNGMLVQ